MEFDDEARDEANDGVRWATSPDQLRRMQIMTQDNLEALGPILFGEKAIDVDSAIKSVEALLPISDRYRELLVRFGGAIMFDNGARLIPDERSPLDGKDGYRSVDILYGLGSGRNSIERYAVTYDGEVPPSFVPIGGAPGGNQICMDSQGAIYLWDHESNRGEGVWRIAPSVDAFLDRLEPDEI